MATTRVLAVNLMMLYAHIPSTNNSRRLCIEKGERTREHLPPRVDTDLCSYVQMLERQQAQLIAGVRCLHQMTLKGKRLPWEPVEASRTGRPLVHQILQSLGVLEAGDPWDEIDSEECNSESPSLELDSAVANKFPSGSQYQWYSDTGVGDISLCSPVTTPLPPSQTWSLPSTSNVAILPWVPAPCQPTGDRHSQSLPSNGIDLAHRDVSGRPCYGPSTIEEPKLESLAQEYPNSLAMSTDCFSGPAADQFISSKSNCPSRREILMPMY
ncbi:MAG: hypothetical protein Q9219_006730, partial [cf. Caloplaca sp. 3 TL-2023]